MGGLLGSTLTALSSLAMQSIKAFGDFMTWLTDTTLSDFITWTESLGIWSELTTPLLNGLAWAIELMFGLSPYDLTMGGFFFATGISLFAVGWLVDFVISLINPLK